MPDSLTSMTRFPFRYFFDACAGIGTFHLGLKLAIPGANMKCIGMAELEPHLQKIYKGISMKKIELN